MVVIKPTRDFTSLNRVSYTASNGSKERLGSVTNRYRQENDQGRLLPQPGKAASTNLEYKAVSYTHLTLPTTPYV